MRVFQVIYSFAVGGSEVVVLNIVKNMGNATVHGVASLEFSGPLREQFDNNGATTWVINRKPREYIAPMYRIWKALYCFKPDVIHTHHLYQLVYTVIGALLTNTPIIHTEHEYASLMNSKSIFLLKFLSFFCRYVTGVNDETAEFLRNRVKVSHDKLKTIVNGVKLADYPTTMNIDFSQKTHSATMVIGIVARLDPVKNHEMLLNAFRMVVDVVPQVRLWIIGDGVLRNYLEELVENLQLSGAVKFFGNRSDVPQLLACMDLLALASSSEGLPMSILEGMAAGKPIVATDVGGVATVVQPDITGLLVPSGDADAMAKALIYLLLNPDQMQRMGANARKLVEEKYDIETMMKEYLRLYSDHGACVCAG
jgi:glycosyltransferase involved in cell wall biosynthesis